MADVAGAFFEPHRVLNIMCCTGPDWYYTSPPRQWLFGIHRSSLDYPKGFLRQMLIRELRDVAILFNSGTGFTTSTADSAETFAINIGLRVVYKAAFVGTGYTAGAGRGYEELREHVRRVQEIQGENAKVATTLPSCPRQAGHSLVPSGGKMHQGPASAGFGAVRHGHHQKVGFMLHRLAWMCHASLCCPVLSCAG